MSQIVAPEGKDNIHGAVDAELAEHANEIRKLRTHARADIIAIGEHLIKAKKLAGHGHWHSWLKQEFGWEDRTAQRYMAVAKALTSNTSDLTHLDASFDVLCLLAAPSTPPEVIQDVAALGRKVTAKDVAQAKSVRKRNCAPASSKPKPTKPSLVGDPIEVLAKEISGRYSGDDEWHSVPKTATTLKVATTAVRDALKSLGGRVETRKVGNEVEFRISRDAEPDLRRQLAAKDARIAELEAKVAEQASEIDRLMAMLTAPAMAMAN